MVVTDGTQKLSNRATKIAYFAVAALWYFLHIVVKIWNLVVNVARMLESYIIALGWLKKYKSIDIDKLRYLAIVIESEDARRISDVIELLDWVSAIGVRHVCLYDMEGVLKESKETILAKCNARPWMEIETPEEPMTERRQFTLEFSSLSDGKLGMEKAANLLFVKHQEDHDRLNFTESLLNEALHLVGCSAPEPDLMLVYGPARCHLGFPAWRIRYTEIVHMECLKSKRYGSLIKAFYRFTTVHQNYGK